MIKILFPLFTFIFLTLANTWACFNSDPSSNLDNKAVVVGGTGGSIYYVDMPGWSYLQKLPVFKADVAMNASFPFTLKLAFSGFINDDGTPDNDIKRMILFYFSFDGWTVLRDIKNPSFDVTGDVPKAIFGHHCIPNSLGYPDGSTIMIAVYLATDNNASFDLAEFLNNKTSLSAANECGALTIGLVVKNNKIAY